MTAEGSGTATQTSGLAAETATTQSAVPSISDAAFTNPEVPHPAGMNYNIMEQELSYVDHTVYFLLF